MTLTFWTDRSRQTVWTQIKGLYCSSFCLHLLDPLLYSKESTPRSNFRVITADFSGVQNFRIFTLNMISLVSSLDTRFVRLDRWLASQVH